MTLKNIKEWRQMNFLKPVLTISKSHENESLEIIIYYQFFIYIKLLRAIEEKHFYDELEELQIHNFNTALIARIM